jgi:excisionase family DNA binding protein
MLEREEFRFARMKKCDPPPYMTLEELVDYARISKRTIYRMLRQEIISFHRMGSEVRFCKSEVDRLVAKRRKEK